MGDMENVEGAMSSFESIFLGKQLSLLNNLGQADVAGETSFGLIVQSKGATTFGSLVFWNQTSTFGKAKCITQLIRIKL